jgi:predicted nucleic acid-binding protein
LARAILADAEKCIGLNERVIENGPILRLIGETRCSAYDLEFVALAQELRAPLYTMDRQLLASFPGLTRPLTPA